jgi:hypothetical protein
LLQGVSGALVAGLRLDDCQREVAPIAEEEVDPLRRLAHESTSERNDSPIRDRALLGDRMRIRIPASGL